MAICSIEGCDNTVEARGLCRRHYIAWRRYGNPLGVRKGDGPVEVKRLLVDNRDKTCDMPNCNSPSYSKGLCKLHYSRLSNNRPLVFPWEIQKFPKRNYPNEYHIWYGIIQRCNNPKNHAYGHYGGRGIKACARWQGEDGFEHFMEDMGARPDKNVSIDRIDNNGDYCPENCRWADKKTQGNNRRDNRPITFNGKTQNLTQWAEELGINRNTLHTRLNRGWSVERALMTP